MGFGLRPAGNEGFWGNVTSTLDWCEENYVVSHYIAEFWNSLSNGFYILLALVSAYSAVKVGAEMRTYVCIAGLSIVGLGSFLFHASLWFETQMLDELPMIYAACIFVYSILRVFPETNKNNLRLIGYLVVYAVSVTYFYLDNKNPVFQEVAYGLLVAILFAVPALQIRRFKTNYPQYEAKIPEMYYLHLYGMATFLLGFAFWFVDNNVCEPLRDVRQSIGYPTRILFELHLWWHLLTSVGSYAAICLTSYSRLLALGRDDVYLKWLGFGGLKLIPIVSTRLSSSKVKLLQENALKNH